MTGSESAGPRMALALLLSCVLFGLQGLSCCPCKSRSLRLLQVCCPPRNKRSLVCLAVAKSLECLGLPVATCTVLTAVRMNICRTMQFGRRTCPTSSLCRDEVCDAASCLAVPGEAEVTPLCRSAASGSGGIPGGGRPAGGSGPGGAAAPGARLVPGRPHPPAGP